jgi:hypothetical protein
MSGGRSRLAGTILALLLAALAVPVLAMTLLDRMIFQPSRGADLTPARLGVEAEELAITTEDGVGIHAWFLPARERRVSLLFLHGNAGNASHRLPNAAMLAAHGADVLLIDYRGYGLSEPVMPDEEGVYADARAGLAWLTEERGIPDREIVVFGRSLGGAVAVEIARGRPLAGLVLESTFTSVADVSKSLWGLPLRFWLAEKLASIDKIREVTCPILFFHGDRDRLVPMQLGQRLFDAAPEPKNFEIVRGAGHNDVVQVGGTAYLNRFDQFLAGVATP